MFYNIDYSSTVILPPTVSVLCPSLQSPPSTYVHLHALAEGQGPVEVHLVGVDEGVAQVGVPFANFLQN